MGDILRRQNKTIKGCESEDLLRLYKNEKIMNGLSFDFCIMSMHVKAVMSESLQPFIYIFYMDSKGSEVMIKELRRIIIVLHGISFISFLLMYLSPGGPCSGLKQTVATVSMWVMEPGPGAVCVCVCV